MKVKQKFEKLNNKYVWFLVSTGIIAGMIYLSDFSKFVESIRTANLLLLIPAFILGIAVYPIWSYVWYRVFQRMGIETGFLRSLEIFMSGQFMNYVTPLGQFGGEPVMAYILKENENVDYKTAISSVFSADVLNAIPVITFVLGGAIYAFLFRSVKQVLIQGILATLIILAIGGPLMYLLWFESDKLELLLEYITGKLSIIGVRDSWIESAQSKIGETLDSFDAMGEDPVYLLKTGLVAHLGHLLQIFCLFFVIWSFGYQPDITPLYFIIAFSGLANFSPTPGGSGTFEAVMAGLVTVFIPEIPFATGISIAIIYRLTTYWPGLVIGYFTLNRINGKK